MGIRNHRYSRYGHVSCARNKPKNGRCVLTACLSNRWPLLGLRDARALGAILGTALFAVRDSGGIKCSTDDVISNTREIPDAATTDQDHTMLLKIVTDAGNVRIDFMLIRQTNTCDFTKRGVRLLRRGGLHYCAHTAFLRRGVVRRAPSQCI